MATKPKSSRPEAEHAALDVQTRPLGSGPTTAHADEPSDDTTSEKEFDPLHFGITELPAGMRQALIAAKLPMVPADQLFDTSPPNKRFAAPPPTDTPDSLPAVNAPERVPAPFRSPRNLVIGVVALASLIIVIALASRTSTPPSLPAATDSRSAAAIPRLADTPPSAAVASAAVTSAAPSSQISSPSAVPAPPSEEPSEPPRTRESKVSAASESVTRTPQPRSAPPAVSSLPVKPQKASGLDSLALPKPE